ncbi:BURP domain protein RD22-like [Andrographis paniculata]|uniref:BURP domain protein RD22-like n=1 Tax=Andrographis paniculata TaxID=175694 RepID=UPI0021E72AF4|nr:BURP domain protein RD22-like [Andrographis paniculata]
MELVKVHRFMLAIFLSVAIMVASQHDTDYNNEKIPEASWTSMPDSLKQLLTQTWSEEKIPSAIVGPGGLNVHAGTPGAGSNVHVGVGGVSVRTGGPGQRRSVDVNPIPTKGITVQTPRGAVRVHVGVNPFQYGIVADDKDLRDNPMASLFFFEKDLRPGNKLNAQFVDSDAAPVASSPEYSDCERSARSSSDEGVCANSLKSMADFAVSKLGKDVQAMTTAVEDSGEMKEYEIVAVNKMDGDQGAVACHLQDSAYYCHVANPTVAYQVSMVGGDGSKAEAAAACHEDTSEWNPETFALKAVKAEPGEESVCHFMPMGDVAWVSRH